MTSSSYPLANRGLIYIAVDTTCSFFIYNIKKEEKIGDLTFLNIIRSEPRDC